MTILSRSFIEEVKTKIAKEYKVNRIELVGSYRRNQAKETSDVDFLILESDGLKARNFLKMIDRLEKELEKPVGLVTIRGLSEDPMKQKVLQSMLKDIEDYE